VWVRLNQINFNAGSGVRKLTLHGNPDLSGDQTGNFKQAEPFVFLAPH
jgi:choloylglycine hydrolase